MANLLTSGAAAPPRSMVRQLEDLLPQIEEGLAQGYSHAVMHAALPSLGINISITYYHRVLRLLRKERREGKQSQVQPIAPDRPPVAPPATAQDGNARERDLSTTLTEEASSQIGNITAEQPQTQPFRWKGQEFLNKDWSNF